MSLCLIHVGFSSLFFPHVREPIQRSGRGIISREAASVPLLFLMLEEGRNEGLEFYQRGKEKAMLLRRSLGEGKVELCEIKAIIKRFEGAA